MKRPIILSILLCLLYHSLAGQDTPVGESPEGNQLIEDIQQGLEVEGEFDYNAEFEYLSYYQENPLNLNEATEFDLSEFKLLSDIQINEFLSYRNEIGELISIYELQAIPSFDLETIRNILPFVKVSGDVDDAQTPIGEMLSEGNNVLFLRWTRILEEQEGFNPERTNGYLGDPNQYFIRYKHSYSNVLSYGFTAEKDRGEEFFRGSNRKGFDYYSAHFYLRNFNQTIKALALGDYSVRIGQGLIMYTGFAYGKSILTTTVKRGGRVIRPYTSVNENNFMRGVATTLGINKNFDLTVFASRRGQDANLVSPDTTDLLDVPLPAVSSLDLDGFHRTQNEIEDRNATTLTTGGGQLQYRKGRNKIAINAVYNRLDNPLLLRPQLYNQFYFQSDRLFNASIDYSLSLNNFNFFGETAVSDNGSIATLNGLLAGLDSKVDLAVIFRHYPRDYHSLLATSFGEVGDVRNETGLYLGTEIRPHPNWFINAYFDTWRHPWLRFRVDGPSRGYEYRFRVTYYQKRKYEAYLDIRNETKEIRLIFEDDPLFGLIDLNRFQARLHFSYKITKELEWRSRLDYSYVDTRLSTIRQDGWAVYQDLLYRPVGIPFSFTSRFALFDTDDFAVRFYNYENGLIYNSRVRAYFNEGSRFYINLRYTGIRDLSIEARFAQLYFTDRESVGSGLEATNLPRATEVAMQIKYKF